MTAEQEDKIKNHILYTIRDKDNRIRELQALNDELVEALKEMLSIFEGRFYESDIAKEIIDKASDVVTKAEAQNGLS